MQVSGTLPQLSDNARKSLRSQLVLRKVAPKVAPKRSAQKKPKEPRDPRTADAREFGKAVSVPPGTHSRRDRARKAAGR